MRIIILTACGFLNSIYRFPRGYVTFWNYNLRRFIDKLINGNRTKVVGETLRLLTSGCISETTYFLPPLCGFSKNLFCMARRTGVVDTRELNC